MLYFLCLVAIGLAIWNRGAISQLNRSIVDLQRELAIVRRMLSGAAPAAAGPFAFQAPAATASPAPDMAPSPIEQADAVVPPANETYVGPDERPVGPARPAPEHPQDPEGIIRTAAELERQFGARLPVWIGGVALALAGFFLVRYTIEIGLLTEAVRVGLGGVFGLVLLAAGHWAKKTSLANGERIGQSLLGAGIADLYATLFMATTLYQLMSPAIGFVAMAAVTVAAIVLSLRHGAPIAVLGLVGGLLTPIMTGSTEPNVPLLFGYLYCLVAGFLALIRSKGWWLLAVPTVLSAFAWVVLGFDGGFDSRDAIWPLLYVIAVCATVVFASHEVGGAGDDEIGLTNPVAVMRYVSLGIGILLAGSLSGVGGFRPMEWSLFGLLTAGAIVLAAVQPRIYIFAPVAALAMSFAMFVVWGMKPVEPETFGVTLVAFAVLHCASGYVLMWRSPFKTIWGALTAAAALGYYLLAYLHLEEPLADLLPRFPFWGAVALGLALGATSVVAEIFEKLKEDDPARDMLLTLFSVVVACFVTLGPAIELDRQWFQVAVSVEVLVAAWLATKVRISALAPISGALLALFGMLILPELALLLSLALSDVGPSVYRRAAVIDRPILLFGVPALMVFGASLVLRAQHDRVFVRVLESTTAVLAGALIYCLTRQLFHPEGNALVAPMSFLERSVVTNMFFLAGLGSFWLGRRFQRTIATYTGVVFSAIALYRLVFFDLLLLNPIWSHQFVGDLPLINALALPFALPIVWNIVAAREMQILGRREITAALNVANFVLLFAFVTLNVRQLYWGGYLDGGTTLDIEVYAYSAAWLLLGVGLLIAGTVRREQMIRIASLVVLLIAIGKVFLIDASSLEGLYRVMSFFGLGVTLIALSWFYTRYVFADKDGRPTRKPPRTARSAR